VCVTIDLSARVVTPWDHQREVITVPAGLSVGRATRAVRAVLIELDTPQPESGAVCFCGAVIDVAAVVRRGPVQMREVVAHGASGIE
jgi:hypothetical protein